MVLNTIKPAPGLLTPDGWVLYGYMSQETLDAVMAYVEAERQIVLAATDVEGKQV